VRLEPGLLLVGDDPLERRDLVLQLRRELEPQFGGRPVTAAFQLGP